ncbi:MAG TPA: hypothetical protein VGI65_02495 [Steroidobacteraceae bacterium]|jgi:hypothetical protein
MSLPISIQRIAAGVALSSILIGSAARAGPEEWQFRVTPYLWLPSVDATLGFEPPDSGGSTLDTDLLKHLRAAFFLNAAASKGDWGLSLDLVYCDFSKASSRVTNIVVPGVGVEVPLNTGTTADLSGTLVTPTGSYALMRSSNLSFDLLAGLRYTHVSATLDWNFATSLPALPGRTGSAGTRVDLWDGIVGLRGRITLADSAWFVPMYLDLGAGTSKFTWQGLLGVGYGFGWGDMLLAYRQLSLEESGAGSVQRLSLSGPTLGATFRF